jgi:hypothetical protein
MNTRHTISQNIVNSILLEVKKLSEAKSSDEVNKYLDQFRSKWKGCGSPSPYVNLYQFGVLDTHRSLDLLNSKVILMVVI